MAESKESDVIEYYYDRSLHPCRDGNLNANVLVKRPEDEWWEQICTECLTFPDWWVQK